MKLSLAVQMAALSFAIAAPAIPPGYNTPPRVSGQQFFLNGKEQRLAGTNAWWMGHLTTDDDVETAMSQIASSGIQVARVWGFGNSNTQTNDTVYYQLIQPNGTSINYGPNGISRLDSAIAHAEKYGVKLVLPFLNNWDDLGGINSYTAAFGGNATTFFTDAKSQEAYKGWIEFAINRYKNSSAIFAWELCNEPRCHGCDSSVIYDWASDISAYIKSLDSTHMVTLGDEGWFNGTYGDGSYAYSGAEGVDFLQNINIPTLDYAVMHLYPDSWGYANESWGNGWIEQHADAAKKAGKPVVLEEYGYGYGTDAQREAVEVPWQQTALESGIAMDQIWQFGTALPSGNKPDDGNTVFYNTTKGSLYDVVVLQNVKAMRKAPLVQ